MSRILKAVLDGSQSCPLDRRYADCAAKLKPSPLRGEVWSYIKTLYESVAETLPDDSDCEADEQIDDNCDCDDVQILNSKADNLQGTEERRKMPPGSVYEQWRQYKETFQGGIAAGYTMFWSVWTTDFAHLGFRGIRSHAMCSVCLRHKLLIRSFSHNVQARLKQRFLYDMHLNAQYTDRVGYWNVRAQARLYTPILCFIIDAMDQAKFTYPRDPLFMSKEFDGFQRPRAHVYGGYAHGFFTLLTVSAADVCKGGSTTVDLIAHTLTMVSKQVDVSKYELYIMLDNASGSNKNNTVFCFAALLALCGLVASCRVMFLRVGHTHEDIDQLFGRLAGYIKHHLNKA